MAKKPDKIRVQTQLKLTNVNPRVEMAGRDEKGSLAVDLAFSGSIHLKELTKLLDDEHASAMLEHLYNAEGDLQTTAFDKLTIGTKVKDCVIQLGTKDDGVVLKDSSFDKITLVPKPGRHFDITARAQVHPTPKQQNTIEFDFYKTVVKVIVDGGTRILDTAAQEEMPLEPGE